MTTYTKAQAHYTNRGTAEEHCAICDHYVNAIKCDILKGRIIPGGYCNKFARAGEEVGEGAADSAAEEAAEANPGGKRRKGSSLPYRAPKPNEADISADSVEFNPAAGETPTASRAWINLLNESEEAFRTWNDRCDNIEERYASLKRLSNKARDREYQLFWANIEVLKPAIYARPPMPVVVPKFQDRRPVYQAASELLERCDTVSFDTGMINPVMIQLRNDMALTSRGVVWCRYESKKGNGYYDREKVAYDFKNRRDFLHSLSRYWQEVWWVAAASYLTRDEARTRFFDTSGDAYQDAEYKVDKNSQELGGADKRERARFWEVWNKRERRVVWVAEGVEVLLDEEDPHLELQGFFPCPCPAYGTVQPNSLMPVPDVLQYADQLDEINMLTGRIHALSDALEAKGFYPAGGAEIADAVQAAIAQKTAGRVLVPISNWAAFGGSKEVIIWLPIDMIAQVITSLIDLRKQVIDDVYQVMGLSDIMRGATDARETLGAQELKTQYGSSRVRDKQYELARVGRELVMITSEIITERFDPVTMIEMSQTQLPTQEMQQRQVDQLQQQLMQHQQQIAQAAQSPQGQQLQQQNPDAASQAMQSAQQSIQHLNDAIDQVQSQPNIEQVLEFLRNTRTRAFTLDIETDSTIVPDEKAEKEANSEFLGVLAALLPQLAQMVAAQPQTATFCGELLKFAVKPYRAGRSLDGAIDELVENMKNITNQPRGDDPTTATNKTAIQIEQLKQQRQAAKDQADTKLKNDELAQKDAHEKARIASVERMKQMELAAKNADATAANAVKTREQNLDAMQSREEAQTDALGDLAKLHHNNRIITLKQQEIGQRSQERQQRAAITPFPPRR
jgi:hypothetical protein